jgi:hypothetical protein
MYDWEISIDETPSICGHFKGNLLLLLNLW